MVRPEVKMNNMTVIFRAYELNKYVQENMWKRVETGGNIREGRHLGAKQPANVEAGHCAQAFWVT